MGKIIATRAETVWLVTRMIHALMVGHTYGLFTKMTDTIQPASFLASFPPIQSAIKIGQDGMRIQFDVPETEMGNAIELLAWRDRVLRVTIGPALQNKIEQEYGKTQMAARTEREPKGAACQEQGADGDTRTRWEQDA